MLAVALSIWLCAWSPPNLATTAPPSTERFDAAASGRRFLDLIGSAESIVVLKAGREFLALLDSRGREMFSATTDDLKGLENGRFDPVALTWFDWKLRDGKPGVLVLAEGGTALYLFDEKLRQRGSGPLARLPQMRGTGVALGPQGHIFVADAGIPGIRVLHAAGGELLKYGTSGSITAYERPDASSAGKFKEPCAIAVSAAGDIVVLDRGNCTYSVYTYERRPNRLAWVTNGPWLPAVDGVRFDQFGRMLLAGPYEFDRSAGALRVLSLDGVAQRAFTGTALGGVSAKVRACQGPKGKYYLADPGNERIVIIPSDFVEEPPRFEWTRDAGVKLTVTRADGSTVTAVSQERPAQDGGRVLVRQGEPICETWPSLRRDDLPAYSLPPAPPRGKAYVIDMPVLVAVFTKAIDEDGALVEIDGTGVIERLQRELNAERLFYWRNSRGTLNKQFEFMLVEEAEPKIESGRIEPELARSLVNQARARRGLPAIGPADSLVAIHPMPGFDPTLTEDAGAVGNGSPLEQSRGAPPRNSATTFAYSGYGLWDNGQAWLMADEWGRQLDGFFEKSGFSDWWLSHPDGTVHIGRCGEHWDCQAFLCRRADKMNWLRLRYGTPRLVNDRDEDGLADDDPSLPLDEKRFGSDPFEPDTDLDGFSDLQEMCAGAFSSADPLRRDTNGNGLIDSRDPYPQFALNATIAALDEQLVDRINNGEPPEALASKLGVIRSSWCDTDVYALYAPEGLAFLFKLRKPVQQIFAPVDFRNDGWLVGQDQVYPSVELDWPPGTKPQIRAVHACEAAILAQSDEPVLLLKAAVPAAHLRLGRGSTVGVCVRLENGPGRVAFLLDPWQPLIVDLGGPP